MTTTTTPRPTRPARPRPQVPLAVWPVPRTSAQYQRAGRYLPDCAAHPAKMLPELARRIVTEYSTPGSLVVDVMAGIGTTVVEAAALDRRAVGVELEPRWADMALANVDHVLDPGHRSLAEIRVGDARWLGDVLGDLAGTVDLICTSPPYACDAGNMNKANGGAGGGLCPSATRNYSVDRSNVGHARGAAYEAAMADIYAGCYTLLRPGGILVTVTKNTRRAGRTLDLAGRTSTLVRRAGFTYLAHVVALHAAVRDSRLVARRRSGRPTRCAKPATEENPPTSWFMRIASLSGRGPPMPIDLPLSVWPTAQRTARAQRAGRYLDVSGVHPAKMLPAIAARAIATYTQPGDICLDPMSGVGTTLVEAVHQGRDAIGIEYEPRSPRPT